MAANETPNTEELELGAWRLRGLAHPLRVKILEALRSQGPATATSMAELLDESTGSMSFHLRQLAEYGFVVEDTDRGVGRERWWKSVHRGLNFNPEVPITKLPGGEDYLRNVAEGYATRMFRLLDEMPRMSTQWQAASRLSDWTLRLTASEAKDFNEQLVALVNRFRRADIDVTPPPESAPVVFQCQLLPEASETLE